MPDILDQVAPGLTIRWKDMGDGTFAKVIASSGSGGASGDVNVIGQRWQAPQSRSTSITGGTQRAAGTIIGGAFAFTTGLAVGGTIMLTDLAIVSANATAAANTGQRMQVTAYVFNSATPSGQAVADGSTFNPSASLLGGAGTSCLGTVTPSMGASGSTAYGFYLTDLNRPILLGSGGGFWVVLVLNSTYTPLASEQIFVTAQFMT